MNKKQIILAGVVLVFFGFFGIKSYLAIEKQNAKYKNSESSIENEMIKNSFDNEQNKEESPFAGQNIYTYSSEFYDIEKNDGNVITKKETTYHTFNFNENTVTQNSIINGKRIDITYPFTEMYEENGILATTYVLKVNTLGVKEIWWSPDVQNLGYDYDDGTRIACYNLKIKTK